MNYLSLDDISVFNSAQSDPNGFIRNLEKPAVIDEFQYCPELTLAVKEASDNLPIDKKGQFILTGSVDIFRSAKTQEALPGHMSRLELYPLAANEFDESKINLLDILLNRQFEGVSVNDVNKKQLANMILSGGYPEVQTKSPRSKLLWYQSYVEGRLYKDFESLYNARGDYHTKINMLVPYLAGICGNLLKYSNVGNDLELNDKLIKSYIDILELMFIIKRVPAYLKNRSKRQMTRMPKLHFVDTGLACHLLKIRNAEQLINSPYYGGLLENFITLEIYKQSTWSDELVNLYHYRDHAKYEVDIIIERDNNKIIGIEVKASSTVSVRDFRGLAALAEQSGDAFELGVLFYSGTRVLPFTTANQTFYALPVGLFL